MSIDAIGPQLGKYRIVARLGSGGMGTVYRAQDDLIDRTVAIKLLRPELATDAQLLDRFRSEAVALARLSHANIAGLIGFEREAQATYMVMEFLPGETLEARLTRGALPWPEAVRIAGAVLDGLEHAHGMGVVHRDIKPANVMLGPAGSIKVMDFGIARLSGQHRQTRAGHAVGTPVYMAPEQLRGEDVDGRTDLYAVGGMLFEMLTGRVAFEATSDYDLMMQQLNATPPAPSSVLSSVPGALDTIVAQAMAKHPRERFASAAAMRDALLATTGNTPAASWSADLHQERSAAQATPIHRDWRAWVAGGAVVAALALVLRPTPAPSPTTVVAGGTPTGAASPVPASSPVSATASAPSADARPLRIVPQGPPVPIADDEPVNPPTSRAAAPGPAPSATRPTPPSVARTTPPPTTRTASSSTGRREAATTTLPTQARATTASDAERGRAVPRADDPSPSTTRREAATPSRSDAMDAASTLLAQVRDGNASALSRVLVDGGASGALLALVRDRRAGAEGLAEMEFTSDAGGGDVSFSTTLVWRSPFGAKRTGRMRVRGTLTADGERWRIGRARVLEIPEVH